MNLLSKMRNAAPTETRASDLWLTVLQRIVSEFALSEPQDIISLLSMPSVMQTINPASEHIPSVWLDKLKADVDYKDRWSRILYQDNRNPVRYTADPRTTPIMVQHVYHLLRFERITGRAIRECKNIVEIGAGFGNLAFALTMDGFEGTHSTYDIPLMNLIQEEYQDNKVKVQRYHLIDELIKSLQANPNPMDTAMIATWSLSEMPMELREKIIPSLLDLCGLFLFAYHPTQFEGINSEEYFDSIVAMRPDIYWAITPNSPCTSRYMFGVRRG